jgi:hypothetical protein
MPNLPLADMPNLPLADPISSRRSLEGFALTRERESGHTCSHYDTDIAK